MDSKEAVSYIESFGWSKGSPNLDRTRNLLHALGDPQNNLKFIHVAGSNGKGSSCAMFDAILRAAGFYCGLYTSPYIQDFCERIQLGGEKISGVDLARLTERLKKLVDTMDDRPSQFELITALAMLYYAEKRAEIVVLEVGLGGEFDATNVIQRPELSCIANIGLEHTEYLGNTIAEIALAKAGIIKEGCPVVCYDGESDAMNIISEVCRKRDAGLHMSEFSELKPVRASLDGQLFSYKGEEYKLSLLGSHQLHNAALVLKGIEVLRENGWNIPVDAVKKGMADCFWPARLEVLSRHPLFILDGGHNPQCAAALAEAAKDLIPGGRAVILCGVLADKDYESIFQELLPLAIEFVCITPCSPRALSGEALAEYLKSKGARAMFAESYEEGIALARQRAMDSAVIAFGSLYMAGEIRTIFQADKGKKTQNNP